MKIFKNKLFYVASFILYLVFIFVAWIITIVVVNSDAYSFMMKNFAANKAGSSDAIEIIYDDITTKEYGNMSRALFNDVIDYFKKYTRAKVIAFDTNITDYIPSRQTDVRLLKTLSDMDNIVSGYFVQNYDLSHATDENLMELFEKNNALNVKLEINDSYSVTNNSVTVPPELIRNVKNFGFVYVQQDANHMLLKAPLIVKIKDSYYPSLPMRLYLLANNTNDLVINDKYIYVPKTGLKIPYLDNLDYDGSLKINVRFRPYRPNLDYSYDAFSARIILDTYKALEKGITPEKYPELYEEGNPNRKYINPEFFKDKTIVVGSNVPGAHADVFKTPMSELHSGVDFQTIVYDNLRNAYFVDVSNSLFSFFLQIFLIFLLPVFAFVVLIRLKFIKGLISILIFDLLYFIFMCVLAGNGIILAWAMPLSFQFVTLIFGYSFKFITENRNKEKIKNAMGKYLSQDIMKNVVSNIDDLKLGGKRAVVTVLFSDIRGFTSMSEKMSAEDVSMILNEYFSEMEPIIRKYNGVINKFIGDAVMAIFGEPIQDINHPQNAVKCAYEMLKKVEYLREKWMFDGKPKIEIGIGINTGEVFVGNIGTENRMEYTVIGDTVNLASRIEHYNKVYKTNLLVSASTYAYIADIADVIKINEVKIRGKAKQMNIYEVLRIDRD